MHLLFDCRASGPGRVCLQVKLLSVDGFVYERLRDTIKGFEVAGYKTKNEDPAFHSFSRTMQLVDRGGRGVNWAWVRRKNVGTFVDDMREVNAQQKLRRVCEPGP